MQNRLIHLLFLTAVLVGVLGLIAGCGSPTPPPAPPQPTLPPQPTTPPPATKPAATTAPVADGAAILESRCTVCHSLDRVKRGGKNKDQWTATVARMIGHGAQLNASEQATLIGYLAKTYP